MKITTSMWLEEWIHGCVNASGVIYWYTCLYISIFFVIIISYVNTKRKALLKHERFVILYARGPKNDEMFIEFWLGFPLTYNRRKGHGNAFNKSFIIFWVYIDGIAGSWSGTGLPPASFTLFIVTSDRDNTVFRHPHALNDTPSIYFEIIKRQLMSSNAIYCKMAHI